MESQKRCKGCKKYLTVPPAQPCAFCYKVNKPSKRDKIVPQLLGLIDGYANRPSNNNYYNAPYGQPVQPPAYGGGYASPVYGSGYYSPQPQQPPSFYPTAYDGGYYNPTPAPSPQALSPPLVYGNNGYYNNYNRQSSQKHEQKRAVLCGVTYKGHRKTLPASINNVRTMHQFLVKLGFQIGSIRILTEEQSDPTRTPTRRNILMAMKWLTEGCRSGDSLVFYYAGHGSRVTDSDGDEKDGYDEALCPVDYSQYGKILDDEVNSTLVAPLPHGATLHSIMDTCFSGTLLDLPYLCRIDRGGFYKWEDHNSHVSSFKGTRGGKAICISACDDHQNSADTSAFTGNAIGVLTYSFVQAVQSAGELTYGDLLDNMRKLVREAQEQEGQNAPFASSTSQEPQLSCNKRFEIYSEPFIM
ncbi:metacaspase-3-like [Rutidosis leptorrhynchoides]|uniref:metacaspase-3-like n=1 Tax=Rutidosis leptorrhynchoides TaxID=125765 RepID=UPI003A98E576